MLRYAIAVGVLAATFVGSTGAAAGDGVELTPGELRDRPAFCAVAEMGPIPEADTWEACRSDAFAGEAEAFGAAWAKQRSWVSGHVTPALARALSRWAQPQMEKYTAVPALDKLIFRPVTAHKARGLVVYEATVDDLPSHSPLVTRGLKVYVLYATEARAVVRVTVTIRGQLLE